MTPAMLHQVTEWLVEQGTLSRFSELAGVIRLHGRFSKTRTAGKVSFAHISDDGGSSVCVEVLASLVAGRGIEPGQAVIATGRLRIRSTRFGLEVRLVASDIEAVKKTNGQNASELAHQGAITLERFRSLPAKRNAFPQSLCFDVSVIHSTSSESLVFQDCISELAKLGDTIKLHRYPVNMLDPVEIASAIRQAPDVGVLIVIRGGGAASDFAVFDDPRVLTAFAAKNAYRVTGLGHSGNQTLLDVLADFSASTPTQAGAFVRETVAVRGRQVSDLMERLEWVIQERNQLQKGRRNLLFLGIFIGAILATLAVVAFKLVNI
jgi:exodeoxyribonuclease VII large subunit